MVLADSLPIILATRAHRNYHKPLSAAGILMANHTKLS